MTNDMLKAPIEVGDVVVTTGKADLRNAHVGSHEEFRCQIDAKFVANGRWALQCSEIFQKLKYSNQQCSKYVLNCDCQYQFSKLDINYHHFAN